MFSLTLNAASATTEGKCCQIPGQPPSVSPCGERHTQEHCSHCDTHCSSTCEWLQTCPSQSISAAPLANPPFPKYPLEFVTNGSTFRGAGQPTSTTVIYWDNTGQKKFTNQNGFPPGQSMMQWMRCDENPTAIYQLDGAQGSDPSQMKCYTTSADVQCLPPPSFFLSTFFTPSNGMTPIPAVWNGTDVINDVKCDRWNFPSPPHGFFSIWGTQDVPCKVARVDMTGTIMSSTTYTGFTAGTPSADKFELPKGVDKSKCQPVPILGDAVGTSVNEWSHLSSLA